jgi:peptide/nickel transport system substrate-binding protein
LILATLGLSACQPTPTSPTAEQTPTAPISSPSEVAAIPSPEASPTAVLPRALTICLGQEPSSLYPYASLNSAARSVLSAIYDGPIDTFANGYQPVILETIPSLKNGDAQLTPISVKRGDAVVDVNGLPTTLDLGAVVLPSGCSDDTCAVKYDGNPNLKMDQLVVTFRMLPKLTWSDGAPLTADDSVYAFKLAADPATPTSKYLTDRTQSYESVDELTVQW